MKLNVSTIIVVLAYVVPALFGIVDNQLNPNFGTALGVSYTILIGLILGSICAGVAALAGLRWASVKPNYLIAGCAFVLMLILFFIADNGWLSSTL